VLRSVESNLDSSSALATLVSLVTWLLQGRAWLTVALASCACKLAATRASGS